MEVQGVKVSCGDIEIHYQVEGEGAPVTLIHGVGSSAAGCDEIAKRLTPSFKVIRMDLRGHGASGRIVGRCHLDDFVADVLAVLDNEAVGVTDVIGFSLGGMIAQCLALTHPGRIRRLSLISAVAGRTPEERKRLSERARTIRAEGVGSVIGASAERWFTKDFRDAYPDKVAKRLAEIHANDPASYAEAYRVFAESDLADRLHSIPHRTLVMTGENDVGSNPRMARFMHKEIVNSQLVILPNLRHSILVEAPDEVVDHLLPFLQS
jgi:pimeloyl-ACP methyl ester carboxylesterase